MEFSKLVKKVRDQLVKANTSEIDGTIAFQFDLTGEDGGTFYIEVKDHVVSVEPYEYIDKNGLFTVSTKDFMDIANRKLDILIAYGKGKINFQGDIQKALLLKELFPPVKPATKSRTKTASKSKKESSKAKTEESTEISEVKETVKTSAKKVATEAVKTDTKKIETKTPDKSETSDEKIAVKAEDTAKTEEKTEEKPKTESKRKSSSKKSSSVKSTATTSK